jgi:AcrR family transcriptional regulator
MPADADTPGPEPSIWTRPAAAAPRRPTLTREAIVRAAMQVADAGGVNALTMHAVAHALGAYTPMSLYRYVYSKEGLIDLMLDAVLAEVPLVPGRSGDWQSEVHALEMRTWTAIMRHPWFAQLVHTRPPLGPNALRRTEYLLAVFVGLGADLGQAMGYVSLVERLVVGLALQVGEEARADLNVDITTPAQAYAALAPLRALTDASDAYPLLARWASQPAGPSPEEQLDLGVSMVLDWIAARYPLAPRGQTSEARPKPRATRTSRTRG